MTMARMTQTHNTDHRALALEALSAARVARQLLTDEYGKPTGRRDYNLIGELRTAARHQLQEAQVHATLHQADASAAPHVVVTVDNTHDAGQAMRRLTLDAARCMGSWADVHHWVHPRCDVVGLPHEPHDVPGADRC